MSRSLATWTTRPFVRSWPTHHPVTWVTPGGGRPIAGGALAMPPLTALAPSNGRPFAGMDPSDPATYTRAWNPQPGMIAYLNFDGAAKQANTDMGGVWGNPVSQLTPAGARPKRRPR